MKAILIIDIDENADFENAIADITFRDNQWGIAPIGIKHWYNGIKLKPLPKYEMLEESEIHISNNWQKIGWNNCLRNIIGEEE